MGAFLRKNRGLIIVLLIVIVAAAAFVFLRKSKSNTASQFQTAAIGRGNLVATVGATGTVRAQQSAVLLWQTSGAVDTVNVKVGDNVPADFVMGFLKKTSLPQNIILAESDLASAQTSLDNLLNSNTSLAQAAVTLRDAQTAYDKANNWRTQLNSRITMKKIIYRTLFGHTFPVLKEYKGYADADTIKKADEDLALAQGKLDDAQRQYDLLSAGNESEITAAQARVDAAQATIGLSRITAPFGGIVTESDPLPGDQVNAGTTAFRLDDLSNLYVDVEVSEVDINNVSVDQPAELTFDAVQGKTYHGQVTEVSKVGTTINGIVNFSVTVQLSDADDMVKPGMTAAVTIIVNQLSNVVLVPNQAVRLVNGDRVVYILNNGKAVQKKAVLGASSDTVSVLEGGDVKEGDLIILNPPAQFQGGPGGGGPGGGGGFGG
jgi:HlyD family secretion protein